MHFLELIERRIRKNLRVNKLIEIKKEYHIEKDEANKYQVVMHFLKKIFDDRLKLTSKKTTKTKTINSNTLDDETQELINYFTTKQKLTDNKIKPLSIITDDEIKKISHILNIETQIKPKEHEILTKKDPQILFSTKKSKNFIEERKK